MNAVQGVTKRYTNQEVAQFASTIQSQLGGNRFTAMTGAKNYGAGESKEGAYLSFKIGGGALKGRNFCRITHNSEFDTYTMYVARFATRNYEIVFTQEVTTTMLYADDLRRTFTEATGFNTSL